jgi:type II secretory pathway pseudopilin PulG
MKTIKKNSGFTLVELALIIVIIGIVASMAMRSLNPAIDQSRVDATLKEMEMLSQAIIGDKDLITEGIRSDFGYVGDIGAPPPSLDALVANPGGYAAWNGPYILNDFVENPDDFKKDAWGNPYVFSGGVLITSAGNGTPITKRIAANLDDLTSNTVYGNVFDGQGNAPGSSAPNVLIEIFYPDGAGSVALVSSIPSSSGQFTYDGMVPIGNHLVRAIYSTADDTTSAYVTVLPGGEAFCELRFSRSYW